MEVSPLNRAILHNNCAMAYSANHDKENALDHSQASVEILDSMAEYPGANVERLSISKTNLSGILADHGRLAEALQVAEDVVKQLEGMETSGSPPRLDTLAYCYNNLSNRLARFSEFEIALKHAKRSVKILERMLETEKHFGLKGELARSLNTLANRYSNLALYGDAAECAWRAIKINEELEVAHPELFKDNKTLGLQTLASQLFHLQDFHQANQVAEKAIQGFEELHRARPNAYRENLADTYDVASSIKRELGEFDEALELIENAEGICLELESKSPKKYRTRLVTLFVNKSTILSRCGDHESSLQVSEKALKVFDSLPESERDLHRYELCILTNNQSNRLAKLGEFDAALKMARRSVVEGEAIFARNADSHRSDLARSYDTLANRLGALGDTDGMSKALDASIPLLRQLYIQLPTQYFFPLCLALHNRATLDDHLGNSSPAARLFKEAILLLMKHLNSAPPQILQLMIRSLEMYKEACKNSDQPVDSELLSSAERALSLAAS